MFNQLYVNICPRIMAKIYLKVDILFDLYRFWLLFDPFRVQNQHFLMKIVLKYKFLGLKMLFISSNKHILEFSEQKRSYKGATFNESFKIYLNLPKLAKIAIFCFILDKI